MSEPWTKNWNRIGTTSSLFVGHSKNLTTPRLANVDNDAIMVIKTCPWIFCEAEKFNIMLPCQLPTLPNDRPTASSFILPEQKPRKNEIYGIYAHMEV